MDFTTPLHPDAFTTHRMVVRDDVELAYVREGVGGVPLVLAHGWPLTKRIFWRNIAPLAEAGGVFGSQLEEVAHLWPDMFEHGTHPGRVMAKYDTPSKRHDYIRQWHRLSGERVWKDGDPPIRLTAPGAFTDEAAAFMSEPFEDADSFRASLGFYTGALGFMNAGADDEIEAPLIDGPATIETLVLYGEHDHLHRTAHYTQRMEMSCEDLVGPFTIPGSGHFVQFEKPAIFNRALTAWCRDLLPATAQDAR